jgi:dihydropteroate synthase
MESKNSLFVRKDTIRFGDAIYSLENPWVMGILNVTPDSFFSDSRTDLDTVLERARVMMDAGAKILDIGGYSTRPGADEVSLDEELKRVVPVIEQLRKAVPEAILSVDTFRSEVARKAVDAGAHMVNDVSGGQLDDEMFAVVAELQVPYVLMHMRGNPKTMQKLTEYDDLESDLMMYFAERIRQLRELGASDIILDPGFGFAKDLKGNYALFDVMKKLDGETGLPILAGLSRKSMINKVLQTTPDQALNGTTALNMLALVNGSRILRVHDVRQAVETVKLFRAYSGDL